MSRTKMVAIFATLLVLVSYSAVNAKGVSVEDILSDGDIYVVAIPAPEGKVVADQAPCWTTNNLDVPPWQGGWPVVTDFYPGDLLAYCTGPIRVPSEDPGPHTVNLHVEQFAYIDIVEEYMHLERADLDTDLEISCPPEYDYVDWYLTVYRTLPGILSRMRAESKDVDWTMDVSGYTSYSCKGTITLYPESPQKK